MWELLGIDPTQDERAIKCAYAARLKKLDPDRDPQGFIALRAARDEALTRTTSGQASPPPLDPELVGYRSSADDLHIERSSVDDRDDVPRSIRARGSEETQASQPVQLAASQERGHRLAAKAEMAPQQGSAEQPLPKPHRSPWQLPAIEHHVQKIEDALFGRREDTVDDDRLLKELARLLRHPDMEVLSRADEIETWLAYTIADAIPRSDALIIPAMSRFGWLEKASGWECPWEIQTVVQRYHDRNFREQALNGEHSLAIKVLARPAPPRTDFLVAFGVRRFLSYIREHHPSLEFDFDSEAVAWWDCEIERRRRRSWWEKLTGMPEEVAAFAEELRRG